MTNKFMKSFRKLINFLQINNIFVRYEIGAEKIKIALLYLLH